MEPPRIPKRHVGCEVKNIFDDSDDAASEDRRYTEGHAGIILPAPFSAFSVHRVLWRSNLESQHRLRDAVLIFRGRELDLCFRLCQLRLTELDDRTQPQAVASLR